ncbi:serine hydrolase, partial [Candidatus Shapirobacteria bacterium]|nr:serine hydrolase [Candidatus Shapirobacteria bacterium]
MVFKGEQQVIPGTKPLPEGESVPGEKKRTRKKQPPKGSRWTIAILFLLTLLAIGAAFLKTSLPPLVQKITVPLVITSQKTEPQFDATSVLNQVKSLTQDLRGKYGLYVYELKSGNEYGVYQTEEFPAASLMKLPVMLLFYQEVEKGNLDPQGEYLLKEKDKVLGAGILPGKAAGTAYNYRYLVELMGQYSDNTAFKIMRQVLGDEQIQEIIDKLGMEKTS